MALGFAVRESREKDGNEMEGDWSRSGENLLPVMKGEKLKSAEKRETGSCDRGSGVGFSRRVNSEERGEG